MVKQLSIGVIGIQGARSEHITSMQKALKETNKSGKVFIVKDKEEINKLDALIIPGGESSTISRILFNSGLYETISNRIKKQDLPIMGTCAGCVLLASELIDNTKDIKLLNAIDMQVERNAFGRQRQSFEKNILIDGFSKTFNAVFIRAPEIKKTWGKCETIAKIDKKIIMVRQDNMLALAFHPELTDDFRIHKYFLDMI